ncbi:metallophosphoesterase [Halobacteriovorax sp.]|uniref:metallophosphoesterase n=1 Tax=Halobacteriovorax sp. TaxID=2020862 RepID=UPI003562BBDC
MSKIIIIITSLFLVCCTSISTNNRSLSSDDTLVDVLGDLEGNIDRFNDFVNKSDVLIRDSKGEIDLSQKGQFVFLGDVMDRGQGSIRIMQELLRLKEKYPDRVTLILGNRDINKLRIMSLMDGALVSSVPDIVIPWHKEVIEETFNLKIPDHISNDDYKDFVKDLDTPLIRFKAFLSGMNAPKAFEFRKDELKILFPDKVVDDHFVFASFLEDYKEDGILQKYLKQGQLGKVIDGNLFVHGAVTSENFGYVPKLTVRESDPVEWINKLNDFAKKEIDDWFSDSRLGQDLIAYHAPKAGSIQNLNSVVYARYSDESGNPVAPGRSLIKKLQNHGIYRVIVGHTPTGDYPIIVRKPKFEIVLTDSSFSSLDKASKISIKGKYLISESDSIHGDKLIAQSNIDDSLNPLGMKTTDGYRVIGKFSSSEDLLLLKVEGEGRKFNTKYLKESALNIADKGLIEVFEQRVDASCRNIVESFLTNKSNY